MAARSLGSGCAAPPAQAASARPLSRAPKVLPFLCFAGRGCSLGGGFLLHVFEPYAAVQVFETELLAAAPWTKQNRGFTDFLESCDSSHFRNNNQFSMETYFKF